MAEPTSPIYVQAREIAAKALGQDISPAVGAIDPAIFALIDKIAEWIIKILDALRQKFNNDPEKVAAALRRPTWLWRRRVAAQISSEIPAKFKRSSGKVADALFKQGESIDTSVVQEGVEELSKDDFILV